MKKDIENREDIQQLVNRFYEKVKSNAILGPIFSEVAGVSWEHHLPKMYAFWAGILLGEQGFSGNPMQIHIALSKRTAMTGREFSEWLQLFTQTTDELFEGEKATAAKTRATNIARLMLHKINTNEQIGF